MRIAPHTALLGILLGVAAALFPELVSAIELDPCPIDGELACNNSPDGRTYVFSVIGIGGGKIKLAFAGILLAMFIYYGIKLVAGADNDSTISEVRLAYGHAIIGTVLVGGAFLFASSFAATDEGTANVLVSAPVEGVLAGVANGFRAAIFGALIFNLSFQGIRLITSQDDSQADKAKKQFLYGMVGAAIVILADTIVRSFVNTSSGTSDLAVEVAGIADFLGTVFGALAVIAIFVGGMFLVLSVEEEYKDRAKRVIFGGLVSLIIVVTSLALIKIFVTAVGGPSAAP